MISNALQHVAQIKLRINSVELGGTEQAVNGRSAFGAGVGSGEGIVLATESHDAQPRSADELSISMRRYECSHRFLIDLNTHTSPR
jgi:hypothetical protein